MDEAIILNKELTKRIIRCALAVHTELGPGLLESVYEEAMTIELAAASIDFLRQVELPVVYKGQRLNGVMRADMVVENAVVLELKSAQLFHPVFEAQIMTSRRLCGKFFQRSSYA